MIVAKPFSSKNIKSPLNYIGGKHKLLNQIIPLFPKKINTFVDLFAGGCNVGINIQAKKIIFNDNLTYLIELFNIFKNDDINDTINHIENRINEFQLSKINESGYKEFRSFYNKNKIPLDLFVLIAYSFNHQIRFNNSHEFNNPFGKNRSSFNETMKSNLINFINNLQNKENEFLNDSFENFNFSKLSENDFVYCDPPYLITTGSYNDGKRGFKGWTEKEETELLNVLDYLDSQNINFALSNVIEHKGNENTLLKNWLKEREYKINYLNQNYANSNYQTKIRDDKASIEVLITNYISENNQPNLFDL
ncbi:MAG TPA: Dam family site-specific DNA-(adenine-N6)-methyltransferase [Flavobacteriaceae bacterium]|nr:Dam family site-specific DNA-(adenine-N6)-methyltransferase [Flavobacteriaceae bacterium]